MEAGRENRVKLEGGLEVKIDKLIEKLGIEFHSMGEYCFFLLFLINNCQPHQKQAHSTIKFPGKPLSSSKQLKR